jgi:hypothetical protein
VEYARNVVHLAIMLVQNRTVIVGVQYAIAFAAWAIAHRKHAHPIFLAKYTASYCV